MKRNAIVLLVLALAILASPGDLWAGGGGYAVNWWAAGGGGGRLQSGQYTVETTIGQGIAGAVGAGPLVLTTGYQVNPPPKVIYLPVALRE
jgi:hypothetical protein